MKGRLLHQVGALVLGSGVAQAIALVCSPLVTRLYSPDDYAVITVFLAVTGVLLPFACGKYEVAIVVAGTDRHASALTALSFVVATIVALAVLVPLVVTWNEINELLGCTELGRWVIAVPVMVLLGAYAMVGRYVANRRSAYRLISQYLVGQAAVSVALNLLLGYLGMGANGLLLANVTSVVLGTGWLLWSLRDDMSFALREDLPAIKHVAHKYRDFPIFNATSSVLDAVTLAMPVFFIARVAGQETLGLYGFMMRIAQAPFSLIGGAVSQVHLKHLSDLIAAGQPASAYLRRVTLLLIGIAAPPTIGLMLFAPELFAFVFGAPWRQAGELLVIMMPSIAIQFVVSTLSPALGATRHNRLAAAWKVVSFGGTLTLFALLPRGIEAEAILRALSIANIALYLLYFFCIQYAVKHPRTTL